MNIGGADASHSVRVEFISDPTKRMLRDPHGTYEMDLVGDKVVSSTFGDAGPRRTLELLKMDFTAWAAAPSSAVSPSSLSAGQLYPTDEACPTGSLVATCGALLHGYCNGSRLNECQKDSGSLAAAMSDSAECGDFDLAPQCWFTGRDIAHWNNNLLVDDCNACADQWHLTPSYIGNCTKPDYTRDDNAYYEGWGVFDYCRFRTQS
jgi:hypothetical protein